MSTRFTLTDRLLRSIETALKHVPAGSSEADSLRSATREGTIALSDVQSISKLLCEKKAAAPVWVHELLLGASPVLPAMAQRAPAHPALAPRLAKLRAAQEDNDYLQMVGGSGKDEAEKMRDAAEMKSYRSQMGVGLNLIVSMGTMFTVGAYGGGTAEEPFGIRAIICGLALMLIAMVVEMALFLIGASRVDAKVAKRESKAARGVMDRTRLKDEVSPVAKSSGLGGGSGRGPNLRRDLNREVDVR